MVSSQEFDEFHVGVPGALASKGERECDHMHGVRSGIGRAEIAVRLRADNGSDIACVFSAGTGKFAKPLVDAITLGRGGNCECVHVEW